MNTNFEANHTWSGSTTQYAIGGLVSVEHHQTLDPGLAILKVRMWSSGMMSQAEFYGSPDAIKTLCVAIGHAPEEEPKEGERATKDDEASPDYAGNPANA